ncbi:MAG TPA: alanine--tRNA ligase [Candidatus Paceibacterota bacterium]|nr:alanine--tRNA ligase [Candidatus Paceibacterota bacterium]
MTSAEVRKRFLAFFAARGHAIIPSASLVPENDPTVLFNTAGMQPLVPYLLGEKHPNGTRLANFQKCVRTNDIDEVGDNTHLTFFEMMGNWSLGDYFKQEMIPWSYELLTNKEYGFGLDPQRLYVTCFEGDENAPRDEESAAIWKGIFEKNGVTGERIYFMPAAKNWWQPGPNGPCGPDTEMFYDLTGTLTKGMTKADYLKADDQQKVVEIWNDVFMEFVKKDDKVVGKLAAKNVDTGSGFERVCAVLQGKSNVFETDLFEPVLALLKKEAGHYDERSARIVADHIRTATFLIADGVLPSNKDQGYILRRLIRRAIFKLGTLSTRLGLGAEIIGWYVDRYAGSYAMDKGQIQKAFKDEEDKFFKTLEEGKKDFAKGIDPFVLWTTYGFPIELTVELAREKGQTVDIEAFNAKMKEHQDLSRAGAEQRFKGGLGDTSEMSVRYHTATHLLHKALHQVLGDHVSQKGSNITPERLRFDFTHGAKMTDDEKKRVEDLVNGWIKASLPVHRVELPKEEALRTGAYHFFGDKYGDVVSVYYVGDTMDAAVSKEFCGGPHVDNTGKLGTFKIQKEEAVSAGVRRIKAVLA